MEELKEIIGELDDQLSIGFPEVDWYIIDGDVWKGIRARLETIANRTINIMEWAYEECPHNKLGGQKRFCGKCWMELKDSFEEE